MKMNKKNSTNSSSKEVINYNTKNKVINLNSIKVERSHKLKLNIEKNGKFSFTNK